MTGRQACLRATAQSRGDGDREHVLVHPRSFALLQWPVPPLWCSWIFGEFPVRLSLNPFCSACALTLRSRLPILALLAFSKRVLALPKLRQESRAHLSPPFWACRHLSPGSMLLPAMDPFFPLFSRDASCPWRTWRCDSVPIFQLPAEYTSSEGNLGKHNPIELVSFNKTTDPFPPLFFDFLLGLPSPSVCLKWQ